MAEGLWQYLQTKHHILSFFSLCTSPAEVTDHMALVPQRLLVLDLELQLQEDQERHDVILMALVQQRQRENARRYRRWWVKPWIMRRRLFGQYHTLFRELERECHGDYMSYIRIDPNMFAELLLRVAPRITKGPRYVHSTVLDLFNYDKLWLS